MNPDEQKSVDALRGHNQRLRLEVKGLNERNYELKDRIKYLEQQNDRITSILHSVGKLLELKIIETENEIETKKLITEVKK